MELDLSYRAWKVFWRNFVVFRKTWLTNIMFNFLEPLLYLAAMGYGMGHYIPAIKGMSYLQFLAPGLIASSAMWATASECTYDSFVRMKFQKTYHAIVATPVSLDEVVVGEMLFGTFKSVLYGTVILLVILLLGLVPSPAALLVPPVLVLCGFAFAELGMIWTGLVPKIDTFSYFFTLIITPMFLFAGVFFPLDAMPLIVQRLAWLIPLYHIVELVRPLVLGQLSWGLLGHVAWLVVFIAIFFYPPIYLLRRRLTG
ncbi:ABC transporter permease [Neomoorella thermoacetica]|uniref:Transport permease protein n=2 Tax=Neomoorella thermoacetica TaxID=1525 RepID=A0A1J5PEH2_NEOTH|nr:ABC transporter permease [Moorella thermoacetica]APC07998.1 inner membrane transport permease YadH [Moorella thermoacetica]OIQ09719.1 inner membrane transport permease YadH [Moorella thermoacetica]OIQ11242.1 inner membrane transport permease YadH [Moorella thermoacetica]OIQ62045.1 inner membrane transport permease YadH [Moorella thermoacetica]GAF26598.1 ABC-type multidrug transport system, permease component [Moorella thermoacetica Y72]